MFHFVSFYTAGDP